MEQWELWLVVAAIPLVQGAYWILPRRVEKRARGNTHVPPDSARLDARLSTRVLFTYFLIVLQLVSNLALLAFTLAHIDGPIGAAFAWVPLDISPTRHTLTMLLVVWGMLYFGLDAIFVAGSVLVEVGALVGVIRIPPPPAAPPTDAES